jgi:PAS domain S-box-containing protein
MEIEEQLRREIAELRAQEERHRDGLQRHLELSRRLREYAANLRAALREQTRRGAGSVFPELAELSAKALDVSRVTVWLLDAARQVLECKSLYVEGAKAPPLPEKPLSDVSGYLRLLATEPFAIDDVATDPRLIELREYCVARGIGALLDVPVVVDGAVLGVVCHEHLGGPRTWHEAEIDFAANLGSVVALAIEAEWRQEAQERAHEAAARYSHLVETLPVVIYSIDAPTGRLAYVSPTIEALVGHTAEAWLAGGIEGWSAAVVDEDRPLVRPRLGVGPDGTVEPELIYRMRRGDGSVIWLRDLRTVVRSPDGAPRAVQGTLEDITAEHSAERRRLELERRYRQLLDHVDLIGVVLDAYGAIVAVNAGFTRTTGVSTKAALGADLVDRFVAHDERERVRRLFTDGIRTRVPPARFECALLTASGARRQVVWTTTLQLDDYGEVTGTASIGLDLTDRLGLEAELAQQRKFESLGRMAASVAHDFNNVLTVISLALARGAREAEIAAAMAYARELVASLMSYARREPIAAQDLDVDAAIGEMAPVLAMAIGKDLDLDLDLRAGGARVKIAPTELRQLVVNMATNAGEATRGHGHVVRVMTVALADPGAPRRKLELQIVDDGRGMDEETRARAFDPFFTTKPPAEGTGIGLATCQAIVSRAGGSISVDSTLGVGTVFRILLPVTTAEGAGVTAAAPPREATADGPARGQYVLFVEDSVMVGDLVTEVLRTDGYDVLHVTSVMAALAALDERRFDVVIADLRLPDGRGEEIVAAALERSKDTAIVVASGDPTVFNGVDAVLVKPFSMDQLKEGIRRAIENRREAR